MGFLETFLRVFSNSFTPKLVLKLFHTYYNKKLQYFDI